MSGDGLLGGFALSLVACLYAAGLAALRRVDRTFEAPDAAETSWWLGYARDLVNLLGFLAFSAGFWILGLPVPHALLAGGVLTLLGYGLDYLVARTLSIARAGATLGAMLLALSIAAAFAREPVARAVRVVVGGLF